MILTHYYHENDRPFQILSSLSDERALSIISSLRDRDTDRVFYHSEYHGKVFNLIEIKQIIEQFGIPDYLR